jgi:mRNA-degrading endonuclease YafQ of YafQ-DinJ toxin-antitoxin module
MIFVQTKAFVRDLSKVKMSDKHFTKFVAYLHLLSVQEALPTDAKDHSLTGEWNDFRADRLRKPHQRRLVSDLSGRRTNDQVSKTWNP